MITCDKCYEDLPDNTKFCKKCGNEIFASPTQNSDSKADAESVGKEEQKISKDEKKQLDALKKRLAQGSEELNSVNSEIELSESALKQLEEWRSRNTASFLWKTFDRMTGNLSRAREVLSGYEQKLSQLQVPSAGVMHKLRKSFHRRLLAVFTLTPLIMYVLLSIPSWLTTTFVFNHPTLYKIFNNIHFSARWIYTIGITFMLTSLLGALLNYYRGWSKYQAVVNFQLWEMEEISRNAAAVRAEELRLAAVYPEVREWLEIIGHSLNNPWKVRPEWMTSKAESVAKESLPYSLHIAQVSEDDQTAMLTMQRHASERFMSRGWRSRVFADQIEVIREKMGLPRERLSVDELDQDIAFSPNGPRAIVGAQITDPEILERVARRQLAPLAIQIQQETMDGARPSVTEVRSGQVNALKESGNELDSESQRIDWDEFLQMSFGDERRMISPLSTTALSDSGQVAGHQGRADSFVITPNRIRNKVVNVKDENIQSYDESLHLPMEIVVRLDFTGPIDDEGIRMLDGIKPTQPEPKIKKSRPTNSGI